MAMQTFLKKFLTVSVGLLMVASAPSWSDTDRVEHFAGESAESLDEALSHVDQYNRRLDELIAAGEVSAETSYQVHQLTYTLENALMRLEEELTAVKDTLERVHLASEANQGDVIEREGKRYLEHSARLFGASERAVRP